MITIENKINCSGCTACASICSQKAIMMCDDEEGFLYPVVDTVRCTGCGLCIKVCPWKDKAKKKEEELEKCYVGYNTDLKERLVSSSGGIFILLATSVIENGGLVFGASFDHEYNVIHVKVDNKDSIHKVVGSKYAQSVIGDVFLEIRKELQQQRLVLFSGTTCQVAGLRKFLRRDFDNLICTDFICLGIPSPLIWKKYLGAYFNVAKIKNINFKDKTHGWHSFSLRIDHNKRKYIQKGYDNLFFRGFFGGLYVRPSCSNCIYKEYDRISDITLADCWGVEKIAPEMDDDMGLSCIVVHTRKGKKLFDAIYHKIVSKSVTISQVVEGNPNYLVSRKQESKRLLFWSDFHAMKFHSLMHKYCSIGFRDALYSYFVKVYRFLRKKAIGVKKGRS